MTSSIMIEAQIPKDERKRQRAVESYAILDTFQEENYDSLTELMCYITNTPISLITFIDNDRNYIKSNCGFPHSETPRNVSFCGHAINSDEIMIVEDARKDERFHDNPLVDKHQAIFYAGVPLINPEGYKLGTLCVYDHVPRQLDEAQKKALVTISKQVVNLLETRLKNKRLNEIKNKLEKRNDELNKFAGVVSHDLKSPLSNILALTRLLEEENKGKLTKDSKMYLEYLQDSSVELKNYIDATLAYYKNDELITQKKEVIPFEDLILKAKKIAVPKQNVELIYTQNVGNITINKPAVLQILVNLLTNAVKYSDKETTIVNIDFQENDDFYSFTVKDNGRGIPEDKLNTVFDLFVTLGNIDNEGNLGTGMGLASVKKLVESQNGNITLNSTLGKGSIFKFYIEK